MYSTLITPPASEPVNLTEVKLHLKLADPTDVANFIQVVTHVDKTDTTTTSGGQDVSGHTVTAAITAGSLGAGESVTAKLQESADDVSYTDVGGGAFPVITSANQNQTFEIDYDGDRRYVRVVGTTVGTVEWGVAFSFYPVTTTEDALLNRLITTARLEIERQKNVAFIEQTWLLTLNNFPRGKLSLPKWPLSSVTSLKYYDSAGVEQTVATSVYGSSIRGGGPGHLFLKSNQSWPTGLLSQEDVVTCRYVAKFASDADDLEVAKQALLEVIRAMYDRDLTAKEAVERVPEMDYFDSGVYV